MNNVGPIMLVFTSIVKIVDVKSFDLRYSWCLFSMIAQRLGECDVLTRKLPTLT